MHVCMCVCVGGGGGGGGGRINILQDLSTLLTFIAGGGGNSPTMHYEKTFPGQSQY